MQMFKPAPADNCTLVGWGVSALLVSDPAVEGGTASRLSGLGAKVQVEPQLYNAMAQVLDDPRDVDLFVVDCDMAGGIDAGMRAFGILSEARLPLPVMLITAQCRQQSIPFRRETPFVLRAPVSRVALRISLEAAFPADRGRHVLAG